jgi:hypothetical protein
MPKLPWGIGHLKIFKNDEYKELSWTILWARLYQG